MFFFQADDGIRDGHVTGVQTCALPIFELLGLIEDQIGAMTEIQFDSWRRGDQQYYVSDTSKFEKATGWKPRHTVREGVKNLHQWLVKNRNLEPERLLETQ